MDYREQHEKAAQEQEELHATWKAKADKETSSTEKKYSVFFGRWQPWHAGHRWLIDQRLNEGKNVWIAIRDVKPDDINPWTAEEVLDNVKNELWDLFFRLDKRQDIQPYLHTHNFIFIQEKIQFTSLDDHVMYFLAFISGITPLCCVLSPETL